MIQDKLLKKNFIWNSIGSIFNSFLSLIFLITVTRINGMEKAGIFTFAFSLSCLFYIIGIYSGRVYQVTDTDKNLSASDYIFSKILSCLVMIIVAIIYCFISKYSILKSVVIIGLTLFKVFEAFSESLYAIMQEKNQLYKVGQSLFFKSLFSLLSFILIDLLTKNIIYAIFSLVIINLIFIIFYDFSILKKLNFCLEKINIKKVFIILKKGFCAFAFAFLTQYVINAPRYALDSNLPDEMQTIFGILIMPSTVLVLLGQFIIHPYLNRLKEFWEKNKKEFSKMTMKLSVIICFIGIFSLISAYLLGIPFLSLLYNVDLKNYLKELLIIIIGATFYEISVILSTSLTTMRSTFSQLIIFIIVSVNSLFISHMLVIKKGIYGASISYLISMFILMCLYIIIYNVIFKKKKRCSI